MELRHFSAGRMIFEEGNPSAEAHVIRSGRVEIVKSGAKGTVHLALLGKGDIFGEMGLLDERPRSASAWAVEDVIPRISDKDP